MLSVPGQEIIVTEKHDTLEAALCAAQGEFDRIAKDKLAKVRSQKTGAEFTYHFADLADVLAAVTPALVKYGILQLQRLEVREGQQMLITELRGYGAVIASEMILPLAGLDPQSCGKIITYYRRYALQALLGVAAERDDDAAETGHGRQPEPPHRPSSPPSDHTASPAGSGGSSLCSVRPSRDGRRSLGWPPP
jgi:hypothetical protein